MILKTVRETIQRHDMLARGDRVVAAVSGGPDSLALVHLLLDLDLGLQIVIAHLDHGLRGNASTSDRQFVLQLASDLRLACVSAYEDVSGLARREKRSVEDAGRLARRRFLAKVAAMSQARRIALGHHRDDQAETVLMRILAGSGRTGLAGIRPVSGTFFIRPLLDCTRAEILTYLRGKRVAFRTDATNDDVSIRRNRVRLEILPLLRAQVNPKVDAALARTAEILRDEDAWLARAARRRFERLLRTDDHEVVESNPEARGPIGLDAVGLAATDPAIARRVVRLALRRAGLRGRDLPRGRVEEILELAAAGRHAQLDLGGGLLARFEYGRVMIGSDRFLDAPRPDLSQAPRMDQVELAPDGAAVLPALGRQILCRVTPRENLGDSYRSCGAWHACLDADRLTFPLLVREPRPGDRMTPLGASGSKKLSDLWTDLKMPSNERRKIAVIESHGEIVWASGLRIADSARISGTTRRVAILKAEPLEPLPSATEDTGEDRPDPDAIGDGVRSGDRSARGSAQPPVLADAASISEAVDRLARSIDAWAGGDEILVLGVLHGSFVFASDLIRRLPGPVRLGFLDREGTPIAPGETIAGARVLLVEDILDTGVSLARILERLRAMKPKEIRICVMFDKPSRRIAPVAADWSGLEVPDRWVVGYGLDDQGLLRNLPYLGWVDRECP